MNERIKELAKQSYNEVVETNDYNGDAYIVSEFDHERFAELIIKECVSVATDQRDWVENMVVFNERDRFWNKARIVQSQRIIDKIRRHFGVE